MAESVVSAKSHKGKQHFASGPEIRFILDGGVEVRGEILNVSHVGMHLRVPVRFAAGTALEFQVRNHTSKGQVLYCRPDGDQFFMGFSAKGDRRSEPRFTVNEPVTLSIISLEGKERSVRGRLVDVSRSGIGVLSESPFVIGRLLEVSSAGGVLYGEVRNCAEIQRGKFRIGILAEETFAGDLREKHFSSWSGLVKSFVARMWIGFSHQRARWQKNNVVSETVVHRPTIEACSREEDGQGTSDA